MGKLLQFPNIKKEEVDFEELFKTAKEQHDNFQKASSIKDSLSKINRLMEELKSLSGVGRHDK